MNQELVKILKQPTNIVYPPFKYGLYIEEYFDKYWQSEIFPEKDKFIYIDIYWTNVYCNEGVEKYKEQIVNYVNEKCLEAKNNNKIAFTLCQWDDGICLGNAKPSNLIEFSLGRNIDVSLPLIVEDKLHRLSHIKKIDLDKRNIFCSFVGSRTGLMREPMIQMIQNDNTYTLFMKNDWTNNIPSELANKFIDITKNSRFALAPRGYGPTSFRFFEIMELGTIPVYVHDDVFSLPYTEFLDYSKFSVCIHINNIANLSTILKNITDDQYAQMQKELKVASVWFTPEGICYYIRNYLIDKYNNS